MEKKTVNSAILETLKSIDKNLYLIRSSLQEKELDKLFEDGYQKMLKCAHTKKEDEVLSIFSEFIDDLDHVTIRIKEI